MNYIESTVIIFTTTYFTVHRKKKNMQLLTVHGTPGLTTNRKCGPPCRKASSGSLDGQQSTMAHIGDSPCTGMDWVTCTTWMTLVSPAPHSHWSHNRVRAMARRGRQDKNKSTTAQHMMLCAVLSCSRHLS